MSICEPIVASIPVADPSYPPPRRSSRRVSGDTVSSDTPISLVGLPNLRRLPASAGHDVSSPIVRPRKASSSRAVRSASGSTAAPSDATDAFHTPLSTPRPSQRLPVPASAANSQSSSTSTTAVASPAVGPRKWPLVEHNPTPDKPVATLDIPQCTAAALHAWKKWGNATVRRYTCTGCEIVVKERKMGSPQVWVPAP